MPMLRAWIDYFVGRRRAVLDQEVLLVLLAREVRVWIGIRIVLSSGIVTWRM